MIARPPVLQRPPTSRQSSQKSNSKETNNASMSGLSPEEIKKRRRSSVPGLIGGLLRVVMTDSLQTRVQSLVAPNVMF